MVYRYCDCCGRRDEQLVMRAKAAGLFLCDRCSRKVLEAEGRRDGRHYWRYF